MNQPSLMEDFFERDLSEAEDEQLAQEISSSMDASQRFAGRMAQAWEQAGLAEPRPPRQLARAWLWGGGAAALLGLALLAASFHRAEEQPLVLLPQAGPGYRFEAASAIPLALRPQPAGSRSALSQLQVLAEPGKGFIIQVGMGQAGPASLSVEDERGQVLAWLNQGSLGAGSHSFAWADPGKDGRYRIVLETSQGSSQRWVRVGGSR
jgi:hypothetical protein